MLRAGISIAVSQVMEIERAVRIVYGLRWNAVVPPISGEMTLRKTLNLGG